MTYQTKKPKLEKNKNYRIAKYPKKETISATYLGEGHLDRFCNKHVFVDRKKETDTYIFADNHWLVEEDGILTHTPMSSSCIWVITGEQISQLQDTGSGRSKSALIKLLNSLGEKL